MPQTKEVQDFLRAIGPFYEIVDEEEEEEEEEGKEGEEGEGGEGVRTGEKSAQATLKNGMLLIDYVLIGPQPTVCV